MKFRGNLKDFLDSKKLDILQAINFGIYDEDKLYRDFMISPPHVNFINPIDVVRIDDDKRHQTFYVFKFPIVGNTEVLNYKPSVSYYELPEWLIQEEEFWVKIEEKDIDSMKVIIDGLVETFIAHLVEVSEDIKNYNTALKSDIQKLVSAHNNQVVPYNDALEEMKNYLLFDFKSVERI